MYFNLFGKLSNELRSNTTAVSECPLQEKSMGLEALVFLRKRSKLKVLYFPIDISLILQSNKCLNIGRGEIM